jgi:hypothetical protein
MDTPPTPPLVLADRLIEQLVHNLVSGDIEIKPDGFMAIRVVFRKCGGNWEKLLHGDIVQSCLLSKIAVVWGQNQQSGKKDA